MAIDLIKRNKCHNFVILEKSSSVGGTWNDNKYPGCCCDGVSCLLSMHASPTDIGILSIHSLELTLQLFLRAKARLVKGIPWSRGNSCKSYKSIFLLFGVVNHKLLTSPHRRI
jgi:hypothetical protein